ncbi:hypothetical protein SK069_06730 [Patulibacter brassicae]|jgi:hypothetical protein|uniref:Uncharacterized protein n=1 Tax=Patulibacter brassicae TaxID=1705717 RepID=A0ABU4VK79_9ACTN|nr:hypothetical protein [Patulibacter brassicae]MDX8151278.1 hypothetical protein [Patulibacter brassicae]
MGPAGIRRRWARRPGLRAAFLALLVAGVVAHHGLPAAAHGGHGDHGTPVVVLATACAGIAVLGAAVVAPLLRRRRRPRDRVLLGTRRRGAPVAPLARARAGGGVVTQRLFLHHAVLRR